MMENTVYLDKAEYDDLQEIAFKYNYLAKLILNNATLNKGGEFDTTWGLDGKLETFFTILEPMIYDTWKKQLPKEEE